jgi:opacity protein-like surface antigen
VSPEKRSFSCSIARKIIVISTLIGASVGATISWKTTCNGKSNGRLLLYGLAAGWESVVTYGFRGLGIAMAAAIVAVLISPAQAQLAPPAPGSFYIGGEGGWTQLNASTITGNGAVAHETFQDGYNVGARAGYQLGPWRFEGEFAYRRNGVQGLAKISPEHEAPKSVTGDRHSYSEMANLIYDFDLAWLITPHVGGGIGAAQLSQNLNPSNGSGTFSSDTVFAYQAIAGLRYLITPAVAFDLDYRYFATVSPKFTTVGGVVVKADHETHNLVASLTLRY